MGIVHCLKNFYWCSFNVPLVSVEKFKSFQILQFINDQLIFWTTLHRYIATSEFFIQKIDELKFVRSQQVCLHFRNKIHVVPKILLEQTIRKFSTPISLVNFQNLLAKIPRFPTEIPPVLYIPAGKKRGPPSRVP